MYAYFITKWKNYKKVISILYMKIIYKKIGGDLEPISKIINKK